MGSRKAPQHEAFAADALDAWTPAVATGLHPTSACHPAPLRSARRSVGAVTRLGFGRVGFRPAPHGSARLVLAAGVAADVADAADAAADFRHACGCVALRRYICRSWSNAFAAGMFCQMMSDATSFNKETCAEDGSM